MRLLQELMGEKPLWPAIKANAYGHGAALVARHLVALGYGTLCVAHASEALELREAGVDASFVLLSAALPHESELVVEHGFEPTVCTLDTLEALSRAALKRERDVAVHVKVDTGMGRIGVRTEEVVDFLERCREHPRLRVKGLMSHFPRADEADKAFSVEQIRAFQHVREATRDFGIEFYHLANSAGIFDLPDSRFDAARPGIAIYGLAPSATLASPRVLELRPVLEWQTHISFLKEVSADVGLSYGHTFRTRRPSLIATLPVGYGDGLRRSLSNRLEVLVRGVRCPQVGTITMDQSLIDVTALRGHVELGDEVVLIGRQGTEQVTADELASRLGTINYEIVSGITQRVPRVSA
jgi:alanine racemase